MPCNRGETEFDMMCTVDMLRTKCAIELHVTSDHDPFDDQNPALRGNLVRYFRSVEDLVATIMDEIEIEDQPPWTQLCLTDAQVTKLVSAGGLTGQVTISMSGKTLQTDIDLELRLGNVLDEVEFALEEVLRTRVPLGVINTDVVDEPAGAPLVPDRSGRTSPVTRDVSRPGRDDSQRQSSGSVVSDPFPDFRDDHV